MNEYTIYIEVSDDSVTSLKVKACSLTIHDASLIQIDLATIELSGNILEVYNHRRHVWTRYQTVPMMV